MRRLLTIEDTFLIKGRGLLIAPGPRIEDLRGPGSIPVELRRPDGSRDSADLIIQHVFISPTPKVLCWGCLFRSLDKGDVPVGTEVWCDKSFFLEEERVGH